MPEQTEKDTEKFYRLATQFTYLTLSASVSHYTKDAFEALIAIAEREERRIEVPEETRAEVKAITGIEMPEEEQSFGLDKAEDNQGSAGNRLVDQAYELEKRAVNLDSTLLHELQHTLAEGAVARTVLESKVAQPRSRRELACVIRESPELLKIQDGILGELALRFYADTKQAYDVFVEHVTELASKVESSSGSINHALGIIRNFYEGVRDMRYRVRLDRGEDPVYDTCLKTERAKKALKVLAVSGSEGLLKFLGNEVLGDGYDIDSVPSFEQGRTLLEKTSYDLVLSPIGKDGSGAATTEKAHAFIKYVAEKGTPVMVMTGSGAVTEEIAQSANGVLKVPFKADEAAKKIRNAIAENVPYFV